MMNAHRRARRLLLVGVLSLLALGGRCPQPLLNNGGEGIVIYVDSDYRGEWAVLDGDVQNLGEKYLRDITFPRGRGPESIPWSDVISSIIVPAGWAGTAYTGANFQGESLSLTFDIPDLQRLPGPCGEGRDGFNDCITSIRVVRP